jgi:glycosyltransferase involved in cell wall biosynthesis
MTPVVFVILQTGALANGGVQSITEVMRRLKTHRPIVLTNLDSDLSQAWRAYGIEVQVVAEQASAGLKRDLAGTLRTYRRYHRVLRDILDTSGARLVHANDPLAFQLSVTGAKLRRARIALNLRDTLDPGRRAPKLKYRAMFAAADHVFYLSADLAERWRGVAPNAKRACSVTYSIVDLERFPPSSLPYGRSPVVLVPGVFRPKKGQLEFIRRVVPSLAAARIETWFAGDFAPESDAYAAACAEAAQPLADHVRFLGYRTDVPDLLRSANVVAVPSRHEGLMRGMIEAMSCGRPVVSFDVCSASEMLEDKAAGAGVVLPLGDYDGMAKALVRYGTDRDLQVAAGRAGNAAARDLFDADTVVERYERVYREIGGL